MKTLFVHLSYSYQIHSYSKFETKRDVITVYPTARLGISQLLAFGKATWTSAKLSLAYPLLLRTDHLSLINSAVGQLSSIYYFYERSSED